MVAPTEDSMDNRMRKKPVMIALVAMGVIALVGLRYLVFLTDGEKSQKELLARSRRAYATMAFDEVAISLQKLLEDDPQHPEANYLLGLVYEGMGRIDEAILRYQRAAESAPGLAAPHYNLAVLYQQRLQTQLAISELEIAVELAPHFSSAHYLLGRIHLEQRAWEAAEKEFRKAIEAKPLNPKLLTGSYLYLGDSYRGREQWDQAIKYWKKALELDPENAEAQQRLEMETDGDRGR
jgi:tetratricopeptide (TPR) repeat protein